MSRAYFRQVPDFEYVSRLKNSSISDYIKVKNLFKRGRLREDIFQNLAFFEKYNIIGDERPDNVAFKFYDDEELDWVILISNNILNIQTEWPLTQASFDAVMLERYGSYDNLYQGIHHYETKEVKNSSGNIIIPEGIIVDEDYSITYFDNRLGKEVLEAEISVPITNYEYEIKIENKKRNIFILKPKYLNIVFNDIEKIMTYEEGAQQYVSDTLKRGDNIRLYQ